MSDGHQTELLLLGLLVFLPGLTVLAQSIDVPYPIALVRGRPGIGLMPGLPKIELEPDLVLVIFLPPLLYAAAFFASLRDLRADMRPISLLAIGLVLFTTVAVAVVAHAADRRAALGGGVRAGRDRLAPPTRWRRPRSRAAWARRARIVTVLEGESLINDATALVAYQFAVAAAVDGRFSLLGGGRASSWWRPSAAWRWAWRSGWLVARLRRRLDDPPIEVTVSLLTGYAAYLPAECWALSGVLAAVPPALPGLEGAEDRHRADPRCRATACGSSLVFLLNALLFLLIGLQLPRHPGGPRRPLGRELRCTRRWCADGGRRAAGMVCDAARPDPAAPLAPQPARAACRRRERLVVRVERHARGGLAGRGAGAAAEHRLAARRSPSAT